MRGNLFLGTESPYAYNMRNYNIPPENYKPFFINHIGRHGSRYIVGDYKVKSILNLLDRCDEKGILTQNGMYLKKSIEKFKDASSGRYGLLTELGCNEEKEIANRMFHNYTDVFGKKIISVSSYVTRAKESMMCFLSELENYMDKDLIQYRVNGKIDPVLRFFDLNESYIFYKNDGFWKDELKRFYNRSKQWNRFISQFFKVDISFLGNSIGLASDIYDIFINSFNLNDNFELTAFFDEKDMKYFWENENIKNYLEKGPSNINVNLPTNIAFGLLKDFLISSNKAILEEDVSANLRFAHAETIIPFASLLGLKDYSYQTNNMKTVPSFWQDTYISPMAANIQWIFYKSQGKPILVKMLYNEKEAYFPMRAAIGPYFYWNDIKNYYVNVIKSLNIPQFHSLINQVKYFC